MESDLQIHYKGQNPLEFRIAGSLCKLLPGPNKISSEVWRGICATAVGSALSAAGQLFEAKKEKKKTKKKEAEKLAEISLDDLIKKRIHEDDPAVIAELDELIEALQDGDHSGGI